MKRAIVDYKKLNKDILNLLIQKFPDGYNDGDVISFRNQHNEIIEAVEVKTQETIYLVKISKRLSDTMSSFIDDENDSRSIASRHTEMEVVGTED